MQSDRMSCCHEGLHLVGWAVNHSQLDGGSLGKAGGGAKGDSVQGVRLRGAPLTAAQASELEIAACQECFGASNDVAHLGAQLAVSVPVLRHRLNTKNRDGHFPLAAARLQGVQRLQAAHVQEVHPGDRKDMAVQGITAYPDVASLPAVPDVGIIAVPGESAIEAIDALGKKG